MLGYKRTNPFRGSYQDPLRANPPASISREAARLPGKFRGPPEVEFPAYNLYKHAAPSGNTIAKYHKLDPDVANDYNAMWEELMKIPGDSDDVKAYSTALRFSAYAPLFLAECTKEERVAFYKLPHRERLARRDAHWAANPFVLPPDFAAECQRRREKYDEELMAAAKRNLIGVGGRTYGSESVMTAEDMLHYLARPPNGVRFSTTHW